MALNAVIHVIDTVLFTDNLNLIIPNTTTTPELTPEPDATIKLSKFSTVEIPDFDKWRQKLEQRSEKRMKREAISKIFGNNCGTKRGPQPRHISRL